ncbi:DUF2750 domain-containing protein [Thalassospira alkalitolerans]|uniref:DUF2750 domain-containing protein n=1 Tax=Thalassospira alkalitolerans TaxID=1293890 RepID=UPI003AA8099D
MTNSHQNTTPRDIRYQYFIENVIAWEGVWALYNNGWLICPGEGEQRFCPFFASRDHAMAWNESAQTGYIPTAITLIELTENLLPDLARHQIEPGISPTGDDGPILPGHDPLHHDLMTALKRSIAGSAS